MKVLFYAKRDVISISVFLSLVCLFLSQIYWCEEIRDCQKEREKSAPFPRLP